MLLIFLLLPRAVSSLPGDVDSRFGDNGWVITTVFDGNSGISDLERTSDGKILALGTYGYQFAVARFLDNGSLDMSFGQSGIRIVTFPSVGIITARKLLIQQDGKIVVVGARGSDFMITRLNSNGSVDSSFGTSGSLVVNVGPHGATNDLAYTAFQLADGRITVVGRADTQYNGIGIIRIMPNGTLDTSFGNGGKVQFTACFLSGNRCCYGTAAVPDDQGRTVVAGYACSARFLPSGSIDATFGQQGVVEQPGTEANNIWRVGSSYTIGRGFATSSISVNGLVLESPLHDSGFSSSFPGMGSKVGYDNLLLPDRRILSVGLVGNGSPPSYMGLLGLDTPFTYLYNGQSLLGTSVIQGNSNRIIVAGSVSLNSQQRWMLVRILTGGTPVFDFDGDGKTDISVFRPVPGHWWYLRSSDGGNRAFAFGLGSDTIVPADFTGDGKTDISFWRPATGEWFVLRSEDSTFFAFPFGEAGDVPSPADFDGDGINDAAIFRPSTSTWFVQRSSDNQVSTTPFGIAGDRPVPADYDGDGKSDVAIFRPTGGSGGGEWWYLRSSDGANRAFAFGTSTDLAVPGDYTGDGKADIAYFRPSTAEWFVLRSEDSSFFAFPWGTAGDLPSPGDYDGDGKIDAAVFRPSNSNWFALRSTAGPLILQFGTTGDRPLPNAFVR